MPKEHKERKDKHLVQLWLDEGHWQQVKLAADSVEEPVTSWIRRAVFQALRKWEVPEPTRKVYDPCTICGKRHDRGEHFSGG